MKISQRVHYKQIATDSAYATLVAFLEKHRSCFDELAIFDEYSHHGAVPLAQLQKNTDVIALRIADLKRRGFQNVGINVHCTMGHIEEGYSVFGQPFQGVVGYKGDVSGACFCNEYEDRKKFLWDKYVMFAKAKPDFIWVDDDVKYFWNGVRFACFCPKCMERFNRKMGTAYTRETLVAEMEQPDSTALREAWCRDIRDRITELYTLLRRAVDSVDPTIPMGLQTQHQGWCTYNTMDYETWFQALRSTKGRPGEGFYDDRNPIEVVTKALSCARQVAEYPDCITDTQYELEDFPNYSLLQKSVRINLDEMTLAIAQGLGGVLLNTFPADDVVTIRELDPLYTAIGKMRRDWDKMEPFARGMHGWGFYPAVSRNYDIRRPLHDGETFFDTYESNPRHNVLSTYTLAHIGIPLTMDAAHACGAVFTGDLADGFTQEELLGFLKRSVILDAAAAQAFIRHGLGEYIGVTVGQEYMDGVEECFTDHPVNEGVAGYLRDVRPAFFGKGGWSLIPQSPKVQVISRLHSLTGQPLAAGACLYENSLGGRVCVLGYAAFSKIDSFARLRQMRRVAQWLAGKTWTVMESTGLAAQFLRTNGSRTMATVINLSLDSAPPSDYGILGAKYVRCLRDGEEQVLPVSHQNGYGMVKLPGLAPFETVTLLAEG